MFVWIKRKLNKIFSLIFFLVVGFLLFKIFFERPKVIQQVMPENWYEDLFFKDKSFSFQFIRWLGYAVSGGSDIGESIATARKIIDGNMSSWSEEWEKTAERINTLAKEWEKEGHTVSAKEVYLRAASYYQAASFYLIEPQNREQGKKLWRKGRDSFLKAISFMEDAIPMRIPYNGMTLPACFIKAKGDDENKPLLILITGLDGTLESLYYFVGDRAAERGYHTLLIEGPGQGEMLFEQNILFRHDWENVLVQRVISYVMDLPGVDTNKIALMGLSMGGYFAPRVAAFDKRIKACIANGGIFDLYEGLSKIMPEKIVDFVDSDPERFNAVMKKEIKKNSMAKIFFETGLWKFGAKDYADFVKKLRLYTLKDVAQQITCPVLVIDTEAEMPFLQGQAKKLYDSLNEPKKFILFNREDTAQAHCGVGAVMVVNERIFNWLDDVLK